MKKLLVLLILLFLVPKSYAAISYSDAYSNNDRKPMAVLIYAEWAPNYNNVLTQFRDAQKALGNTYNFVELNLASEDAANFTEDNVIWTKLPYIMLYRNRCKFAKQIKRGCTSDSACIIPQMKAFLR